MVEPPRPDLQELVAIYGTYSGIPTEAWEEYDYGIKTWTEWLRSGERYAEAVRERQRRLAENSRSNVSDSDGGQGQRAATDQHAQRQDDVRPGVQPGSSSDDFLERGEPRISGIPELEET